MTNIQSIRLKQFGAAFLVTAGAAAWVFAEFSMSPAARVVASICTILAAIHLGWRFEHDRTRDKRADATWVAFYGKGLLEGDGVRRLKTVFERFVERAKGEEFDGFGCTKLLLSEEVSKELFAFLRDRERATTTNEPQSSP
jgi:hypothetical protein